MNNVWSKGGGSNVAGELYLLTAVSSSTQDACCVLLIRAACSTALIKVMVFLDGQNCFAHTGFSNGLEDLAIPPRVSSFSKSRIAAAEEVL